MDGRLVIPALLYSVGVLAALAAALGDRRDGDLYRAAVFVVQALAALVR